MNKTNLLKKFLLGVVCIMAAFSFVGCGGGKNGNDENSMVPDPGGEYADDHIVVQLTEQASSLDKEWIPVDFPEFAFSVVKNEYILDGRRWLTLWLVEPGKENVLRAVYQIRKRTDVHFAAVSMIVQWAEDEILDD